MWFEVLAGEQSPHSWRVSSPLGGPGEVPTNPDCSEREWPGCVPWFRDSYRLGLPLWGAYHEAVELFAHFDLTRQPRVRLNAVSEIEHIRFHRRGFPNLFLPSGIDIDVAGRTRACATAFSLDSRNRVVDRGLHDGRPHLTIGRSSNACRVDKSDFDHKVAEDAGPRLRRTDDSGPPGSSNCSRSDAPAATLYAAG